MNLLVLYITLALMFGLIGSASAQAKTFVYELDDVTDLDISTGIELELRCGDENIIRIDAEDEEDFRFRNNNRRLSLSRDGGSLFSWLGEKGSVTASVVLKSLPESYEVFSGVQARIEYCDVQGGDVRVDQEMFVHRLRASEGSGGQRRCALAMAVCPRPAECGRPRR